MEHRFDESELLELIEGELEPTRAASLLAELADDRSALAFVREAMKDRAALQALKDPILPVDFVSLIEPRLTRSMLIDSPSDVGTQEPGSFRRRRQRPAIRIRWERVALAAVVVCALLAGIWAVVNGLVPSSLTSPDRVASTGVPSEVQATTVGEQGGPFLAQADSVRGTIHHAPPMAPTEFTPFDLSESNTAGDGFAWDPYLVARTEFITADFALVLTVVADDDAETSLRAAAGTIDDRAALLRNFSFEEALLIEQERFAPAEGPQARNKIKPKEITDLNLQSGPLFGPLHWHPSPEQQVDFANRGAAYTVAIPASLLAEFLERLSVASAAHAMLQPLPPPDRHFRAGRSSSAAAADRAAQTWMAEGERIRDSLDRFSLASQGTVVWVPVIVRVD